MHTFDLHYCDYSQMQYHRRATDYSQQPPTQGLPHGHTHQTAPPPPQQMDNLLDLLRHYPVMWQGHLTLKNDSAAVQLHFLSGNVNLAKVSLPQPVDQCTV